MKQFSGYAPQKMQVREHLPVGAYISVIKDAKIVAYPNGSTLVLMVDIAEGDQRDFFLRDFRAQDGENKKWRGTLRINIPTDDGSKKDALTKRIFNDAMACIEESNPGYHWNWDEASLKGKKIGHLSRESEWEYDGKTGWRTELCYIKSIDDIRNGKYQMPAKKPLKNKAAAYSAHDGFVSFENISDDLPFEF